MLESLIQAAEEQFDWRLDRNRYLLVGNAFSKFSVFLFAEGGRGPACIAKAACNDAALEKCRNEYLALQYLANSPLSGIFAAAPIGTVRASNYLFFVQEYIDSRLMLGDLPLYRKRFLRRHFSDVANWLSNIYIATRAQELSANKSYSRCFQHGDFWLGNLGAKSNQLIMYDLEFSKNLGLPLYDLIHFGVYYYRVLANVGAYTVIRHRSDPVNIQTDRRELALQGSDIRTVLGSENTYSKIMYSAIFKYISKCCISDEDALKLILQFVGHDRNVEGLPESWETKIESTYRIWRSIWNES